MNLYAKGRSLETCLFYPITTTSILSKAGCFLKSFWLYCKSLGISEFMSIPKKLNTDTSLNQGRFGGRIRSCLQELGSIVN
jgi:hypothetical protein